MALDILVLGGFVFTDFAVPDRLPAGGKQVLNVQRLPGGSRAIDAWGPDDHDRSWSGILWGDGALDDALTLDAMRASGAELPYSNGVEARTAVISDFSYELQKFNCIHYRITIVTSDDSGGGAGSFAASLDNLVGADLGAALSLLP